MHRHHLELLVCVKCGSGFHLDSESANANYIVEGSLRCEGCDHSIPISGGVPRFNAEGYVANFSKQWKRFVDFERFYEVDNETYYSEGLGLTPSDVAVKRVLEIGCGNGRAVGHFLQSEPELFVAIDLSEAVNVVEKRYGRRENLLILQCDIANLPLRSASFDIVFSYGVLHHTPDPKRYFQMISRFVAPAGRLAIYVYRVDSRRGAISNLIQRNSHRLPRPFLISFCGLMTLLGYSLYWQSRIPGLKTLYKFNLLMTNLFFRINPSKHLQLNYLWAHDFHTTKYTSYHEPAEIYEWYERAGFRQMRPLRGCGMIGRRELNSTSPESPAMHDKAERANEEEFTWQSR